MSNSSVRFAKAPSKNNWYLVSGLAFLLFLVFSAVGMVIFQSTLEQPQDLRQQAMVADGKVELSFDPATATTLQLGVEKTINLKINTHGNQIDGIELFFNIISPGLSSAPELTATNASFQTQVQEVQQVTDGYLVSFRALIPPNGSFSSTEATTFAQLKLTPSQTGELKLNFDVDDSIVTIRNANPVEDELKTVQIVSYNVLEGMSNSPSPTPSATPITCVYTYSDWSTCTNGQQTRTVTASPPVVCEGAPVLTQSCTVASPTATPTVTPSPSASPTASPAVGGTTYKQCNESCSSNDDCQANFRCYDTGSSDGKRCRLVTNVSSTSCAVPADDGLQRSCNEYCADARECANGYTCHYNRCRHPQNVDSQSCTTTSTQQQAIAQSCNKSCTSNRECAANMRCFYGSCRLASNPSSSSCSVATSSTVSSSYSTKGGSSKDSGTSTTATKSGQTATSTTSGTIFKASPKPSASPAEMVSEEPTEDTLFDTLTNSLTPTVKKALMGVGGLILFLIIIWLLTKLFKNRQRPPQMPPSRPHEAEYQQELQAKINALQKPVMPVQPVTPVITTPVQPVVETPVFTRPTLTTPQPTSSSSSMMERIRNKGITHQVTKT